MVESGLHKDSKCHLTAGNALFSPHSALENGTRSYFVDVHAVVLENFIKKYRLGYFQYAVNADKTELVLAAVPDVDESMGLPGPLIPTFGAPEEQEESLVRGKRTHWNKENSSSIFQTFRKSVHKESNLIAYKTNCDTKFRASLKQQMPGKELRALESELLHTWRPAGPPVQGVRLPRSPESVKISEATSGVEIPRSMSSSMTPGEDSDLASDPGSSYQTRTPKVHNNRNNVEPKSFIGATAAR
ncbi:hypothetical protein E5288_WYG010929 [Bos mutus]|uniref:Uncharacterized protein n=1 Tax=Bos mutus TaxID=72004 RepID=A0A6B0QWA4_9CETA|nr:hypothetical protein [Bos mutus]